MTPEGHNEPLSTESFRVSRDLRIHTLDPIELLQADYWTVSGLLKVARNLLIGRVGAFM